MTLYEYYTQQGKALPSVADRTADYRAAGVTGNITADAGQNSTLLSYLQKPATPPVVTAPAVVTSGSTPPTVGQTYKTIQLDPGAFGSDIGTQVDKNIKYNQDIVDTPVDENSIRKSFRDRIQGQLDAMNNVYNNLRAKTERTTANNLGGNRAGNARAGLLGSDFANADQSNIQKSGDEAVGAVEAERTSKVNALINDADDSASTYLQTLRTDKTKANEDLMTSLLRKKSVSGETSSALANYLLGKGVANLSELAPGDLKKIKDSYGVDEGTLAVQLEEQKRKKKAQDLDTELAQAKVDAEKNGKRFITVADGAYVYDTQTGSIKENKKDFAPGKSGATGTGTQAADVNDTKQRIANIESAGSKDRFGGTDQYNVISGEINDKQYQSLSSSEKANQAYGKFQVMGFNIPKWSKEVLGKSITIDQFLNDSEAQEKIAEVKMQDIYDKYGDWEQVPSVWFSGRPMEGNTSSDRFGTSVPSYIQKFRDQGGFSSKAQEYIDSVKSGRRTEKEVLDTLGSSATLEPIRREVVAGLNTQNKDSVSSEKMRQTLDVIGTTIAGLESNKDRSGSFWTGISRFSPVATKSTDFVNQVNKLTGQFLALDGVTLKTIFGPQISNTDAATIKEIIGSALDPYKQTPETFQVSLNDLKRKLELAKNQYATSAPATATAADPLGLGI